MEPIVALNQIIEQCHKINLSFVRIKVPKESKSYLLCYEWKEWPNNLNDLIDLNNISENSIWRHILISSWCHSYIVIDIRRFNSMCPLPLCCSNYSQKCKWKIEETQRKMTRKKTSIWKQDIAFLNFLINIAFAILATFQVLVLITLSTLRHWATHDVRWFKRWLAITIFELLSVVYISWE